MKFYIDLNKLQISIINYIIVGNMINEKERLHHFRFSDSGDPPDFALPLLEWVPLLERWICLDEQYY